jgi:hypothetical protein
MPPSLDHVFPDEIVDRIIGFVDDQSSRYNLCLVSKSISHIAISHLYENVSLSGPVITFLPPFAYLMFSSPEHASYVKTLSLPDGWDDKDEPDPEVVLPDWPEEPASELRRNGLIGDRRRPWPNGASTEQVLHTTIKRFAHSEGEHDEWFDAIWEEYRDDAIVALLLPSLPRLRLLVIGADMLAEHGKWTALLLERVGTRQRPFEDISRPVKAGEQSFPFAELDTILLSCTAPEHPARPYLFGAFLHLPALKYVYSNSIGHDDDFGSETEPTDTFRNLQPHSSSIVSVQIRDAKFQEADLVALFNALKPGVFKEFMYELGHGWSWPRVPHARIMGIMKDHRDMLETLSLTHDNFYIDNDDDDQTAVSFSGFSSLKRLRVAPIFVWGNPEMRQPAPEDEQEIQKRLDRERSMLLDALPRSLEELVMVKVHDRMISDYVAKGDKNDVETYLLPALAHLTRHLSAKLPHLKRLAIVAALDWWKDSSLEAFAAFAVDACEKGLTVEAIDYPERENGLFREKPWGWNDVVMLPPCPEGMNTTSGKLISMLYCNPVDMPLKSLADRSLLGQRLVRRVRARQKQYKEKYDKWTRDREQFEETDDDCGIEEEGEQGNQT